MPTAGYEKPNEQVGPSGYEMTEKNPTARYENPTTGYEMPTGGSVYENPTAGTGYSIKRGQ